MILSRKSIEAQMNYGNIVIDPFYPEQLGPNSYDLHLGKTLLELRLPETDSDYSGEAWFLDVKRDIAADYHNVEINKETGGFLLLPGTLYLGVTAEYTESRAHVPIMEGKSSLGRMGIESHVCAGMGDVGFCGYWTLEIRVTVPTILYPGMPIGQIVWHTVDGMVDTDYKETGSYNNLKVENPKPGIPNLWKKLNQFISI